MVIKYNFIAVVRLNVHLSTYCLHCVCNAVSQLTSICLKKKRKKTTFRMAITLAEKLAERKQQQPKKKAAARTQRCQSCPLLANWLTIEMCFGGCHWCPTQQRLYGRKVKRVRTLLALCLFFRTFVWWFDMDFSSSIFNTLQTQNNNCSARARCVQMNTLGHCYVSYMCGSWYNYIPQIDW